MPIGGITYAPFNRELVSSIIYTARLSSYFCKILEHLRYQKDVR